jgi:Raf kinase inhibitor-like YbhB/YbcL family protein
MGALDLTSPAFDAGDPIPDRYGYTAANVNPPLRIEGVPEGAETLALVVDDPDAVEPAGTVWDHWVVWNIAPDVSEIPEDCGTEIGVTGQNDYGERAYGGPNPPDRPHEYRFRLFALDDALDLPRDADADAVVDAAEGHVLDTATLTGTYAP